MNSEHSIPVSQRGINTLAQNGTTKKPKPIVLLTGKGSELSNDKAIKGRAKRKLITQKMVLSLIDVSKNKSKQSDQMRLYWNTYHCLGRVFTAENKIYGKYCKNRCCTLCCSIRKAEIINKYLPVVQTWPQPYFVTLTIKAVPKKALKKHLEGLLKAFNIINQRYRKRNQRGSPVRLMGLKSLECNFNPKYKTYNPHLHLIVQNKGVADILIEEWLKIWTIKHTNRKGQFLRPVHDTEKDLIEIIKYGSKIFTEPDVNNKTYSTVNRKIYAAALNNIFIAMKDLRIFDRFGFDLPKQPHAQKKTAIETTQYDSWTFRPKSHDWLNTTNDESLTEYQPHLDLLDLLANNINSELE